MLYLINVQSFGESEEHKLSHTVSEEELKEQRFFIQRVRAVTHTFERTPLAYTHSYGCQQNVSDGEKINGMLAQMGFDFTDDPEKADLVLYNTCAVRENAENRVFGNVGALKHCKERNPDMIIAVCGCMVQQEQVAERFRQKYPFVDMVFGTHVLHRFPELLYTVYEKGKRIFCLPQSDGVIAEHLPVKRDSEIKASVPIMYGCNNFCTYCIVPYVRGRERSRSPEAVINEVKSLVKNGYKEIMLLGQNVNSYGNDLDSDINFPELLRRINAIEGDFIVRFMSSHPKDATNELIDTIIQCDKIGKHLHLPLQSGSNTILKAMNRRYTVEKYMQIIDYARSVCPDFSFTTDIIVGFPNESDEDFNATLDIIKKVGYDNIYSFIYSKRTGTKAALIDDRISDEEKSQRMRKLLEVQREISDNLYKRFTGRTMRVLVDCESRKHEGFLNGKSSEFIIAEFKGDKNLIGQFADIKVTDSKNWAVCGEIIQPQ